MATEEQIRGLAHFIWEKEGCPEGRAEQHYFLAEQILERQGKIQTLKDNTDIKNILKENGKTAWYHFHFNIAVWAIAIATALSFLTPPTIIAGLSTIILGGILSLLGLVLIITANVKYRPQKYVLGRFNYAFWIMIVGIVSIPIGSWINYIKPCITLGGFIVFLVGLCVAVFPKRKNSTI